MSRDFTWRDAGRTVVLRRGALAAAPALIKEHGFGPFHLFSTPRALASAPELAAAADSVHEIPPGQIPDLAADLLSSNAVVPGMRGELRSEPGPALVALGGGRVVDVAKALASVVGAKVAALPTTMSGAEMTAIHRLPAGAEDRVRGMVRPALVIADPEAMTSQPELQLRASSMNALAHGADSLYTPLSNPVSEMTALRGAGLIAAALDQPRVERDNAGLALGSLLCGYAIDSAGYGLHHVVCQTLVRICGSPHGETNAAILPEAVAFLAARAPEPYAELAAALGTDPAGLAQRIRELGQPAGLGAAGADRAKLGEAVEAMLRRPELGAVPGSLSAADLDGLIEPAW
ncbi:MAG TPA: iron-containing alcohol dehydrogenase [Solirubrobacterales bacterium]|nr:iron-containing alcohol dehydrogenase [Solirubrobacterales bacterium]